MLLSALWSFIDPLRLEAYPYAFKRIVNSVKIHWTLCFVGTFMTWERVLQTFSEDFGFCLLVENVGFDGFARGNAFPLFKACVWTSLAFQGSTFIFFALPFLVSSFFCVLLFSRCAEIICLFRIVVLNSLKHSFTSFFPHPQINPNDVGCVFCEM